MHKHKLNEQLNAIGWGLFLLMIGGIGLIPEDQVPGGLWLIGVGVIMLTIAFIKAAYKIRISWFSMAVGIVALIIGIGDFLGVDLPLFPVILILIGASMILGPLIEHNRNE